MTDHWAYAELLPEYIRVLSKAESYTIEVYISVFGIF
jgi:hypothetical protein